MNWKVFFASMAFLIVVDLIWIGVVAQGFYSSQLSELGRYEDGKLKVVYWSALMVYLLLPAGLCIYVLPLAASPVSAFIYGAGFGCVTYGIYDFTNYATLKGYPLPLVWADLAWGSFVCGLTTLFAFYVSRKFA